MFDGIDRSDMPVTLQRLPQFPAADIDDIASAIESVCSPLTSEELDHLRDVFSTLDISADEVLIQWPLRRELADRFKAAAGRQVADEVLVREVLRMRKRGDLSPAPAVASA